MNRWRQRKRNGRHWQNTARERKSLYSRRLKETELTDKKLFAMLGTIDFTFGKESYKVAESGILFAYEIGMENGRPYVVALTEKFGTIIFYIPEGIWEKLVKRAQMFPCPFREYLSFLIEFKDFERLVIPFLRSGVSPMGAAAVIAEALTPHTDIKGIEEMRKRAANTKAKTNNWLKMHGYPMRRKGRGKKKHE